MTDANLESFREDTARWLQANAPALVRTPPTDRSGLYWGGRNAAATYDPEIIRWCHIMRERGWTAPSWPKEYGGGGLNKEETKIFWEEMFRLGLRPPLTGFGLQMIGPVLLQEGNEEQKREHLTKITAGEIRWCQGYSEPGAGSDLASLKAQAIRDGDHFVLNGQKTWTSYGDKSDWMFILVRTDATVKKQLGITFLLMDMATPGVSVRPILLISGASPFTETFLENVRVPVRNVIGAVNAGWSTARALLGHERTMIASAFHESEDEQLLVRTAREQLGENNGVVADPVLRDRIAQLEMDQACLDLTMQRSRDGMKAGHKPGPETSIFKLYGTELNQRRRELLMSILGPQALGWEGPGFAPGQLKVTRDWLRSRGNTIEGGTSEVQLNIISKRVLGLPG